MSNKETNAFLEFGAPPGVKLSGLEYGLYFHICHRYDTRAEVRSAYPGMDEFRRTSTMSRSAIECALTKLKDKGLITQVKKGYIGSRAEYVPTYSLHLLANSESVAIRDTLGNGVLAIPAESVSDTGVESPAYAEKVSSPPVTISNVSNINNSKYDSLRFSFLLSALPGRLRTVSPGKNLELLLNRCDDLGIRDDVFNLLRSNRWDNVPANPGGIVNKIIKDAIERKELGQLVAPTPQVTPIPAKFVSDNREPTPPSAESQRLMDEARRIMKEKGSKFGTMPE